MISAATAIFVSTVPRGCVNLIWEGFSSIGAAHSSNTWVNSPSLHQIQTQSYTQLTSSDRPSAAVGKIRPRFHILRFWLVGFDTPERADNVRCDDQFRCAQASRDDIDLDQQVRQFEF